MSFYGRYEHSLDAKGRITLPARIREEFPRVGILTEYFEGCLALFSEEEFEEELTSMKERAAEGGHHARNLVRARTSNTFKVDIDSQGRMPIQPALRAYAELENEVVVVGNINHIELWAPRLFAEIVGTQEHLLREGVSV